MAEELRSASKILPRAMIWTIVVNGLMAFVMLVLVLSTFLPRSSDANDQRRTFLYTLGDLTQDLETPSGYPIIQVFVTATGSTGGAAGLTTILIVLGVAGNLTTMAGSSRQLFSFARDKGVPFHNWVARVPVGYDVPVPAIIVSACCSCILHCINIGSSIAFNIIMSIGTVALLTSYMTSIGSITWRRIHKMPLLPSKFSLGRFGLFVNISALLFCLIVYIFAFFPPVAHPDAAAMNWAIAVYGGVLLIALIYYIAWARRAYVGPVAYVRKGA